MRDGEVNEEEFLRIMKKSTRHEAASKKKDEEEDDAEECLAARMQACIEQSVFTSACAGCARARCELRDFRDAVATHV